MRTTRIRVALAALAMAGLAAVLFLQQQRVDRLRAENTALRAQVGELAALRAEQQRGMDQSPAATETTRLREQQAELLRLRGEVTRLRNEVRQNGVRGAAGAQSPALTTPASGQTVKMDVNLVYMPREELAGSREPARAN